MEMTPEKKKGKISKQERETERQTDRQADRQTDRQINTTEKFLLNQILVRK